MPKRNTKGEWVLTEEDKKRRDAAMKNRGRWRKHELFTKRDAEEAKAKRDSAT